MENLIFSLNATVPVFLLMVLGFVFHKIGWIDEVFASKMNKFVFKAALPMLLFEDLATVERMFRNDLNAVGPGIDAPMWEKEKFWEKWLLQQFDAGKWRKAQTPSGTSGGWIGLGVTASDCTSFKSTKLA